MLDLFFLPFSRIIPRITKAPQAGIQAAVAGRSARATQPTQTDGLRLGRIVRLLMDNATVVVSGTKIAEEIGTSRSEVWRLVQQLRTLGVEIAGHPATGYQLKAVPDLLLPDMLAPLLKGTIFGAAQYSSLLQDRIDQQRSHGELPLRARPKAASFVAEEQTAGRGRGAHQWESAPQRESIVRLYCVRRCRLPSAGAFAGCGAGGARLRCSRSIRG